MNRMTRQQVDAEMHKWFNIMKKAMMKSIPSTEITIMPHPKLTSKQRKLQNRYRILKQHADHYGWTPASRNIYRSTQDQLREESTKAYNANWRKLIENTQKLYRDPKEFWRNIRRLMGSSDDQTPYLYNTAGEKVYSIQDKVNLFKEIWTNIFRISPAENEDFDTENDDRVNIALRQHRHRTEPYLTSDIGRLNTADILLKPMEMYHMKLIIKNMKDKAPGESGITKSILEKCPNTTLIKLKELINHALSIAYFPQAFKEAILCFVLKEGKDGRNPNNYRLISLLEIPGKIMERLVNDRLTEYLENNNRFNENQYAFRKGRGTQQAISLLNEKGSDAMSSVMMSLKPLTRCG